MKNSIGLSGQWIGHFTYGPEYGEEIHGEKVQFRLFLEDLADGQFEGTGVDVEGFGSNMDTATIKGFVKDGLISFIKEYPKYYVIDETGKTSDDVSTPKPRLSYFGRYDSRVKSFTGKWELWTNEKLAGDGSIVDIFTGTWEMTKDDL